MLKESALSPERPSEILFPADRIQQRVVGIANDIRGFYKSLKIDEPVMIALLNGARPFAHDLNETFSNIGWDNPIHLLHAHSYEGDESTGALKVDEDALNRLDLEGRHALVIDDVLDSGVTARAMDAMLREGFGAASTQLAVMVDKVVPGRDEKARFTGFKTDPNHWIFGYGMDQGRDDDPRSEAARHLPYIARFTD